MSCRGLVTSKISPELFVFMKTKTYVCDINQFLVIMKSMLFTLGNGMGVLAKLIDLLL